MVYRSVNGSMYPPPKLPHADFFRLTRSFSHVIGSWFFFSLNGGQVKKKKDNSFCSDLYEYFTKNSRLYYFVKIRPQSSHLRIDCGIKLEPVALKGGIEWLRVFWILAALSYHHGLTYQPTILKLIYGNLS